MGSKSKQKGNRYERRCAKLLSDFTGINFRKVPASGGWNKFGGQVVAEHAFTGDVICDRKEFIFSVEAKSQKAFSFNAMLKSPKTAIFTDWWKQCVEDAQRISKFPMLMFKPDVSDDFVAFDNGGVLKLDIESIPHFTIEIYGNDLPTPKIFQWKAITSAVCSTAIIVPRMFGD